MSRSKWKPGYISYSQVKRILTSPLKNNFEVEERDTTVFPLLYNKSIRVYNGKIFKVIVPDENYLYFKLGCFANPRASIQHKKKVEKNK